MRPPPRARRPFPAAVIAVVDLDRVTDRLQCLQDGASRPSQPGHVARRAAKSRSRLRSQTEQKSIQAAIDALEGQGARRGAPGARQGVPDQAPAGAQELAGQQEQIQRNQQYIQKQIEDKLGPIYQQVMQRRGANVLLEVGATLATSTSVDVTNDVLAALNSALPTHRDDGAGAASRSRRAAKPR